MDLRRFHSTVTIFLVTAIYQSSMTIELGAKPIQSVISDLSQRTSWKFFEELTWNCASLSFLFRKDIRGVSLCDCGKTISRMNFSSLGRWRWAHLIICYTHFKNYLHNSQTESDYRFSMNHHRLHLCYPFDFLLLTSHNSGFPSLGFCDLVDFWDWKFEFLIFPFLHQKSLYLKFFAQNFPAFSLREERIYFPRRETDLPRNKALLTQARTGRSDQSNAAQAASKSG